MTTYEWGVISSLGTVWPSTEDDARRFDAELSTYTLVRRTVGPWEPVLSDAEQAATDAWRERLTAMLDEAKVESEPTPVATVPDLMAALEASLVAAREARDKSKGVRTM